MAEPSNTVQILVACAMQDTRLIHSKCVRWGRTTETGSHNNVCAMQGTRLIHSNCLQWGRTTEMGSCINVCAIYGIQLTQMNYFRLGNTTEMVQLNKMCVICSIQFTWMNCLRWAKRTQTSRVNKMCVIRGKYSRLEWTVCDEKLQHRRSIQLLRAWFCVYKKLWKMQTSCLRWLGVSHTMRLRVLVCDD